MKLSFTIAGATSVRDEKAERQLKIAEQQLNLYMRIEGLVQEKNGRKLIRYDSKKYKMPWIYLNTDGKTYKCDDRTAKSLFAA